MVGSAADVAMISLEADRLYERLRRVQWTYEDCVVIAPMTLRIAALKKQRNAIILSHSYQTPDIMYGVADFVGDSYSLSVLARDHPARTIIFCSVLFMGETAKILSPEKTVIVPTIAGCSLADSITPEDVRRLRKEYPSAGVVCYVNTSASVKAESDVCCTSANAREIIDAMEEESIIFIPDLLMGRNIQKCTKKKLILWKGRCVVHENFTRSHVDSVRERYEGVKVIVHSECDPDVVASADHVGSTSSILAYIAKHDAPSYMVVTECGVADRARIEYPDKHIVGSCGLCPYMKKIMLRDVLNALENPPSQNVIEIDGEILWKARRSLERMYEIEKK